MRISGLLAGSAAALALVGVAIAQDTVDDYVRSLIADNAGPEDKLVGSINLNELEVFESAEVIFTIDPTKTYRVYGACDDDCSNIELEAHDEDEIMVDNDANADAEAELIIEPGDAGSELHVVISLNDCDTDACVVGFGVYEAGR